MALHLPGRKNALSWFSGYTLLALLWNLWPSPQSLLVYAFLILLKQLKEERNPISFYMQ